MSPPIDNSLADLQYEERELLHKLRSPDKFDRFVSACAVGFGCWVIIGSGILYVGGVFTQLLAFAVPALMFHLGVGAGRDELLAERRAEQRLEKVRDKLRAWDQKS